MKELRVYVDTSVIGGCFDEEFREGSRALFQMVRGGKIRLIVSDILIEELEGAPENVREEFGSLPPEYLEAVNRSEETESLKAAYLAAGVVGVSHENDAHHVAIATVAGADLIVSWNFRHIVHFDKIRGFNAVNLQQGYSLIDIRTPQEVI